MKGVISLKEDRNCGNYPVYPNYYGGMPGPIGVNMPMPMPIGMPTETYGNMPSFNYGSDNGPLASQLNSLEQRVSKLENMINGSTYSSNSYNTTNYQMM